LTKSDILLDPTIDSSPRRHACIGCNLCQHLAIFDPLDDFLSNRGAESRWPSDPTPTRHLPRDDSNAINQAPQIIGWHAHDFRHAARIADGQAER
jgi:ferredoxin